MLGLCFVIFTDEWIFLSRDRFSFFCLNLQKAYEKFHCPKLPPISGMTETTRPCSFAHRETLSLQLVHEKKREPEPDGFLPAHEQQKRVITIDLTVILFIWDQFDKLTAVSKHSYSHASGRSRKQSWESPQTEWACVNPFMFLQEKNHVLFLCILQKIKNPCKFRMLT